MINRQQSLNLNMYTKQQILVSQITFGIMHSLNSTNDTFHLHQSMSMEKNNRKEIYITWKLKAHSVFCELRNSLIDKKGAKITN